MKNSQRLLVSLVATQLQAMQLAAAEHYRLDSSNTQVSFAVQRLGFQWITARFSDISGEFVIDPKGAASKVDVSVGIASLDCSEPRWNARLRSAEWLDAEHYPRMNYHSDQIELADQRAIAHGELTLHGVTHPIVLNVTFLKCATSNSCQFAAHGQIRRSEYGLPHGFWSGGDQVDIHISGTLGAGS